MEMIIILVVLALLAFWVARIYNQLVELQVSLIHELCSLPDGDAL